VWTISLYRKATDAISKCVLGGSITSLQDPESLTYLALDECIPGVTEKAMLIASIHKTSSGGSIFDQQVGTKMLWVVEHDHLMEGGPIQFQHSSFTLRNLNSGLFVKYDEDEGMIAVNSRSSATRFEASSLSAEHGVAIEDHPLQLSCNGLYLSSQHHSPGSKFNRTVSGSPSNMLDASAQSSPREADEHRALLSAQAKREMFSSTKSSTSSFDASHPPAASGATVVRLAPSTTDHNSAASFLFSTATTRSIGEDVFVCVQATRCLRNFEVISREMKASNNSQDTVAAVSASIKSIFSVLETLLAFLTKDQRNFGGDEVDVLIEPHSFEIIATRQILAREQGLLDVLLDIIQLCGLRAYDKVKAKAEKERSLLQSMDSRSMRGNVSMKLPPPKQAGTAISFADVSSSKGKSAFTNVATASGKGGRSTFHRKAVTGNEGDDAESSEHSSHSQHDQGSNKGSVRGTEGKKVPAGKLISPSSSNTISSPSSNNKLQQQQQQVPQSQKTAGNVRASFSMGLNSLKRNSISGFLGLGGSTGAAVAAGLNLINFSRQNKEKEAREVDNATAAARTAAALQARQNALNVTVSQELGQTAFRVLLAIIRHNHANQIRVADRFSVVLRQVRNQEMAVACVHELLHDNSVILQQKLKEADIKAFVLLLVEFEMNVVFMKLLQNACSGPNGVDSTQKTIARLMFTNNVNNLGAHRQKKQLGSDGEDSNNSSKSSGASSSSSSSSEEDDEEDEYNTNAVDKNRRPVILSFYCEFMDHALTKIEWNSANSIYIPSDASLWTHIYGNKLLTDGYPRVFVKWKNMYDDDSEFSMLTLFNTNSMVSLDEICLPRKGREDKTILVGNFANSLNIAGSKLRRMSIADVKKKRNSKLVRTTVAIKRMKAALNLTKGESQYDKKCQLRDYLVSQLYLMADLCLDRNYVSIEILENLLDYETLMSILLGERIQTQVKAAACRIIRTMYIDREPQVLAVYPKLVKSSHVTQAILAIASTPEIAPIASTKLDDFSYLHFSLVQQVISEYIRTTLNDSAWDELSAEMMNLLAALIGFGFYDPVAKLRDVLIPVITAAELHRKKITQEAVERHRKTIVRVGGPVQPVEAAPTVISNAMLEEHYDDHDDASEEYDEFNEDHEHQRRLHRRQTLMNKKHGGPDDDDDEMGSEDGNGNGKHDHVDPHKKHGEGGDKDSNAGHGLLNLSSVAEPLSSASHSVYAFAHHMLTSVRRFLGYRRPREEGDDDEVDEEEDSFVRLPWQEKWYQITQDMKYLYVILFVVVGAIVVVILEFLKNVDTASIGYFAFDIGVTGFFALELVLRWYCYVYVRGVGGNFFRFYRDILNVLDAVLVGVDLMAMCTDIYMRENPSEDMHGSERLSTGVKVVRAVRFIRLLRILRAARVLRRMAEVSSASISRSMSNKYNSIAEQEVSVLNMPISLATYF
jgi:hypothetical protein